VDGLGNKHCCRANIYWLIVSRLNPEVGRLAHMNPLDAIHLSAGKARSLSELTSTTSILVENF
jgi:hypothetical protein